MSHKGKEIRPMFFFSVPHILIEKYDFNDKLFVELFKVIVVSYCTVILRNSGRTTFFQKDYSWQVISSL